MVLPKKGPVMKARETFAVWMTSILVTTVSQGGNGISGWEASLTALSGEDLVATNPQAVAEVLAGNLTTASAAWWGFDPEDSTAFLQAAIRSGAQRVVVPRMPSPWIVDKIQLESDQEIFFQPGTEVVAKKGAFRGKNDCLFEARNKTNIRLIGYGATLRMHRSDYAAPPYEKAEWRHVLSLRGCSNVLVEGLTLAESGGDGIYLGAGRNGEPNCDVIIRHVTCERNYRQGISVITAKNLLIEHVTLRGTAGTPPAAGIDFEPNHPHELLVNCVMRHCVIDDNQGLGIVIYLGNLNAQSEPVFIRIENCVTRGSNARSFYLFTRNTQAAAVRGTVEVVSCRFEDNERAGILIRSKPASGLQLRFLKCTIADPAEKPRVSAPLLFVSGPDDTEPLGGVMFENLLLEEKISRPPMALEDPALVGLKDVIGDIKVRTPEQEKLFHLEPKLIAEWCPISPLAGLPIVPLETTAAEHALGHEQWEDSHVPRHRLRHEAAYALWVRTPGFVNVVLTAEAVGSLSPREVPIEFIDNNGRVILQASIKVGSTKEFAFDAKESGLYLIRGYPGQDTLRLVRSTCPAGILGVRDRIHLFQTAGVFAVCVPGNNLLALGVSGQGDAERVSVELRAPDGKLLWEKSNVAEFTSTVVSAASEDRILLLRLSPPSKGILEDVTLRIRGVPPLLVFHSGN